MAKTVRILVVLFVVVFGLCSFFSESCPAARYPDHQIQMIIPYPPGGQGDMACRMLIEELEKLLNTKIIPNNKPGAGTVVGADAAARVQDGLRYCNQDRPSQALNHPFEWRTRSPVVFRHFCQLA